MWLTDPTKHVFKNPHKNSMIRPSNLRYTHRVAEFHKHFTIIRYTREPFTFISCSKRRFSYIQRASAFPKVPPSALVFYWLSYLTCILSLMVKKGWKTLIFTQLKMSRHKQDIFAVLCVCLCFCCCLFLFLFCFCFVFLTNSYDMASDLFTVVWPQAYSCSLTTHKFAYVVWTSSKLCAVKAFLLLLLSVLSLLLFKICMEIWLQ